MNQWVGSVTKDAINLVRVGGDGLLSLLVPALLLGGVVALLVAFAAQIEIVLTVLATLVLVAGGAKPAYVLATELTWPWEQRRVQAFSAEVDRAMTARDAALEPAAPLRVTAERVHELEASVPEFDLNVSREALTRTR